MGVLAIPPKRFERALIDYLTDPEVDALLAAPDTSTWTGRRDHALIALAIQTGLRVSKLLGLRGADLHLGAGAHVACHGKGRKDRITPLTRETIDVLERWLAERAGQPDEPVFVSRRGTRLSRDAIDRRLALCVTPPRSVPGRYRPSTERHHRRDNHRRVRRLNTPEKPVHNS